MKIYQTDKIKNLVLLGNSGSGKTSIAEAMLFNGGIIDRIGTVEAGNTVSDYNKIEQDLNIAGKHKDKPFFSVF